MTIYFLTLHHFLLGHLVTTGNWLYTGSVDPSLSTLLYIDRMTRAHVEVYSVKTENHWGHNEKWQEQDYDTLSWFTTTLHHGSQRNKSLPHPVSCLLPCCGHLFYISPSFFIFFFYVHMVDTWYYNVAMSYSAFLHQGFLSAFY